jgi:hypothetical protein
MKDGHERLMKERQTQAPLPYENENHQFVLVSYSDKNGQQHHASGRRQEKDPVKAIEEREHFNTGDYTPRRGDNNSRVSEAEKDVEANLKAAQHGDKAAQQRLREDLGKLSRDELKQAAAQMENDPKRFGEVKVQRYPNGDVSGIIFVPPLSEHILPISMGGAVSVGYKAKNDQIERGSSDHPKEAIDKKNRGTDEALKAAQGK